MLDLDSAIWSELRHAYGPASDTPRLIEELEVNVSPRPDESEPWFTLWSSLCHQGDVYLASYAAVPHFVRICLAADKPVDFSFFALPGCIEIARANGHGPALPKSLTAAYRTALADLPQCAARQSEYEWDDNMVLSIATALAAAKGRILVADAISNMDERIMQMIVNGEL